MDIDLAHAWMRAIAAQMDSNKGDLTQLDSAIGDADHGVNMQRGFTAVLAALDGYEAKSPGDVLVKAGNTLIGTVGGAAGPLYGSFFRTAGKQLTAPAANGEQLAVALDAGLQAVRKLGAASPGDKTMVDALTPALAAFAAQLSAGQDVAAAAEKAAGAADAGVLETVPLEARKGRASYLGPRSIGHQDPGATSAALIMRALAEVLQS
jgi:dihydroxyacetone kinase-like protein